MFSRILVKCLRFFAIHTVLGQVKVFLTFTFWGVFWTLLWISRLTVHLERSQIVSINNNFFLCRLWTMTAFQNIKFPEKKKLNHKRSSRLLSHQLNTGIHCGAGQGSGFLGQGVTVKTLWSPKGRDHGPQADSTASLDSLFAAVPCR